jgi:hypothetical protein
MSARKTGTPCSTSCSAISWRVLVLPVPGRARDEAVPVHHRERDLDLGLRVGRVVEDRGPELERRPVEGVAGRDLSI